MSVGTTRGTLAPPQFIEVQDIHAVMEAVLRIVSEAWNRVLADGVIQELHRRDERKTAGRFYRYRDHLQPRRRSHLKQNGDPLELFHLFLPFSSTSAL